MTKIVPGVSSETVESPSRRSAKRCLFGRPEEGENEEFLRKRLGQIQAENEKKWGFDFSAHLPISTTSSQWTWFPINSLSVPAFYHPVDGSEKKPVNSDISLSSRLSAGAESKKEEKSPLNLQVSKKFEEQTPKKRKCADSDSKVPLFPTGSPKKPRTRVDQYFVSLKHSSSSGKPKKTESSRSDCGAESKISRVSGLARSKSEEIKGSPRPNCDLGDN